MNCQHLRQILKHQNRFLKTSYYQLHSKVKCSTRSPFQRLICHRLITRPIIGRSILLGIRRQASTESTKESSKFSKGLVYAIYGSFVIGAFLWVAIFLKWLKNRRLQWRGIVKMDIPQLKRINVYKYKNTVLPEFVVKIIDDLENFQTRSSDIFVVSFPRSGTTWLQEIVYLIQSNVNTSDAQTTFIDYRFPYLEYMVPGIKEIDKMPSPRLLKSHLPYSLLPESVHEKKPKIIYIARNPKDVAVSYYHYVHLLYPVTRYEGDFKDFFDLFMKDKVMYGPWSNHVEEFWEHRQDDNIFFVTYEDLKKDTAGTIKKLADFLGKSLTDQQIDIIVNHCSFQNMKENPATNHTWFQSYGIADFKKGDFIRKGCVGDWANYFTVDMNDRMNKMVAYKFRNSDLNFSYRGTHFVTDENALESNELE